MLHLFFLLLAVQKLVALALGGDCDHFKIEEAKNKNRSQKTYPNRCRIRDKRIG
jgi:hypothetical protein